MEKHTILPGTGKGSTVPAIPSVERRLFLRHMGLLTASATALLASCSKGLDFTPGGAAVNHSSAKINADGSIDLGSGDVGILNYAYALEQLETAFYMTAVEKTKGLSSKDLMVLQELRDHELVHREFFRAVLGANAIPDLEVDFSGVDWNNRNAVFDLANKFESTGVGAYNGAARYIQNVDVIGIAGKIVSVEARHASLTGHMLLPNSKFSIAHELIDSNGLDVAYKPAEVLPKVQPFLKQKLSGANLPTA
ncbi:ferritin-like domain-containing protein [Runella sp.]|uniref:ferritin-like domain-containing protein n=1 Tax=Runella sp. TaxID=1960881 RepID=UPI003D0A0B60